MVLGIIDHLPEEIMSRSIVKTARVLSGSFSGHSTLEHGLHKIVEPVGLGAVVHEPVS